MTDRELNKNRVMWCDVQLGLSESGLDVDVYPFPENGTWKGELYGKPFTMTISPTIDDNKSYAIVSLYGQDESIIVGFSKFMGYEPVAKYKDKSNPSATANYEWWINEQQQEQSLKELRDESKYFDLTDLRNDKTVK